MGRLDGKVAFVTGGARGIGRAIAQSLAEEGADIIVCDICNDVSAFGLAGASDEDLSLTVALVEKAGRRCYSEIADVRNQRSLDRVVRNGVDKLGRVNILVANAGGTGTGSFWNLTEEEWTAHVDINLNGAWRSAKAVAPYMIDQLDGSIVFIASVRGVLANWDYAHYIAAKHGVLGLMKAVALELGGYGVRANAVLPGIVDTPANDNPVWRSLMVGRANATREEWLEAVQGQNILRGCSVLPPAAIANAVLWLASDEAKYVTGLQLVVDAGHTLVPFAYGPVHTGPIETTAEAIERAEVIPRASEVATGDVS